MNDELLQFFFTDKRMQREHWNGELKATIQLIFFFSSMHGNECVSYVTQNSFTGMSSKFHSFTSGHSDPWITLLSIPFKNFFFLSLPLCHSLALPKFSMMLPLFMHWSVHSAPHSILPKKNECAQKNVLELAEDKSKNVGKKSFNLKTLQY